MLENVVSEVAQVGIEKKSLPLKKAKNLTVKDLCQDEDIAAFFRLVFEKDLRKKAIEALEKRIFDIRTI